MSSKDSASDSGSFSAPARIRRSEPNWAGVHRRMVKLEERGRGQQHGTAKSLDERADHGGVERAGMTDHPHSRIGGEPEHRVAERVEERQDSHQAVVGQHAIDLGDRLDIGIDVEMREDDALGIARAAAAEDDGRGVVDVGRS